MAAIVYLFSNKNLSETGPGGAPALQRPFSIKFLTKSLDKPCPGRLRIIMLIFTIIFISVIITFIGIIIVISGIDTVISIIIISISIITNTIPGARCLVSE